MLSLLARRATGHRILGSILRRFFLIACFSFAGLFGALWGIKSARAQCGPLPTEECEGGCTSGYNNLGYRIGYIAISCEYCGENDDCETDQCYDEAYGCGFQDYCIADMYAGQLEFSGCQEDY